MRLKVFVPDREDQFNRPYCTPMIYPFLKKDLSAASLTEKYGDWILAITFVHRVEDCDIAMLMYELNYYYKFRKLKLLHAINAQTVKAGKLLICAVKGDVGITPGLSNFHLYRWGGYASKNAGNQFALPVFIGDPLPLYSNGQLLLHKCKTARPVIGFCGQGKGGLLKLGKDMARGLYRRLLKLTGSAYHDAEPILSSTYTRSKLLDQLERSDLTDTCFIRYKRYRNGVYKKEEQQAANEQFFRNIMDTQYTFCYRGAGNFSVRLFETLACGRIPVIAMSDNNLPLPEVIDWNRFPVVQAPQFHNIASVVSGFHHRLSDEAFVGLQQYARDVWERHLQYRGFMRTTFNGYLQQIQKL